MIRAIFVIDSLSCGGAERSLLSLLPLIDYECYAVDVMIVQRGGVFEQYLPKEVHIVPVCRRAKGIVWLCQIYFSLLWRVQKMLGVRWHGAETQWTAMRATYAPSATRYDVAIAYQQGFPTYYVATKVRTAKRYAWINVDMRKAGYRESFNRKYYDKMDACVAVSDGLREMLLQSTYVDGQRLRVIYDIVNVALIRRMAEEQGFNDSLPVGTLRLVTVGRMTPPKNYPLAVATAQRLKEQGLAFRWYFVGDGSQRNEVETMIAEQGLTNEVVLLGMRPNPYPFMREADIYVQTSAFEGFCLTLCEARLLHKPVVTTNFPVAYNQITDGQNGLLAAMTAESLAEKILLLAHDGHLRKHLVANTCKEQNTTATTEIQKVYALLSA